MLTFIRQKIREIFQRWMGVAKPPQKRVAPKRRPKDHFGSHYYLGDLLDSLDSIFSDLPEFKSADPDAYRLFNRVGATIMSSSGLHATELEPHVIRDMPSFGCYHINTHAAGDSIKIPAGFVYYQKMRKPVNVQPTNGTCYRVGCTYHFNGRSVAFIFYVSISPDGAITTLRVCEPRRFSPSGKFGPKFTRMSWDFPEMLKDAASDNGKSPTEYASELFAICANSASARESGLTVRVRKGAQSAAFAIDMTRTPYFFSDREKTVNENGSTKKIFHIVRGHWRKGTGGSQTWIKSHFRGLKDFSWNGYDVSVRMSGRDALALSSFGAAGENAPDDTYKTLGADELAARLEKVVA